MYPQNSPDQDLILFAKNWYKSDKTRMEALTVIIDYHYLLTSNIRDIMIIVNKDLAKYLPRNFDFCDKIYNKLFRMGLGYDDGGYTEPHHIFAYQAINTILDEVSCIHVKTSDGKVLLHVPEVDPELVKRLQLPMMES